MVFNDFASLIQLAAVFNGAFVLSKEFSGKDFISIIKTDLLNINDKVCVTFSKLSTEYNSVKDSLKELKPIRDNAGSSTNDKIEGAKIEVNDKIEEINREQKEFGDVVDNYLTVKRFGKLCLANFFFCIVTLFFSGCCNYQKPVYLLGFSFYVFLVLVFEIVYAILDFKQNKKYLLTSKGIIYIHMMFLVLASILGSILVNYFNVCCGNANSLSTFVVIGVLLPFLNFIAYYFYIGRQNKKINKLLIDKEQERKNDPKLKEWREIITFHIQSDKMFIASKPNDPNRN